jgi:Domain of unknown function (DUF4266)
VIDPQHFHEDFATQGAGIVRAEGVDIMKTTTFAAQICRASNWSIPGRALALVMSLAALTTATGCANVAPYERAKLAHPTMAAADLAGHGESHLRAISEGAIGGSAGAGSGCGCN